MNEPPPARSSPVAQDASGRSVRIAPDGACAPLELAVDLQVDATLQRAPASLWLPDVAFVNRHARAALAALALDTPAEPARRHELSVRLVDEAEGRTLNHAWRGVDRATNVLSFEADLPALDGLVLLGDLVFCAPLVQREAAEQGKAAAAHWAHLIVHGTLHLCGLDHVDARQAQRMEALEIRLLSNVGIADPYGGTADDPDE